MNQTRIRFAGPGDETPLTAMIDAMDRYYGDSTRPTDETRERVSSWLRGGRSDTRFVLAFAEEEPVGLAVISVLHPGHSLQGLVFLKDLFVATDWRSLGIGEHLMKFLAEFCQAQGLGRIDWSVENDRSQAFYERLGARVLSNKRFMRLDSDAIADLAKE